MTIVEETEYEKWARDLPVVNKVFGGTLAGNKGQNSPKRVKLPKNKTVHPGDDYYKEKNLLLEEIKEFEEELPNQQVLHLPKKKFSKTKTDIPRLRKHLQTTRIGIMYALEKLELEEPKIKDACQILRDALETTNKKY